MAESKTKSGVKNRRPSSHESGEGCEFLHILLCGVSFAVLKEEVLEVAAAEAVCRLPLTPSFFKGLTHIEGKTSYVFNLSNLIGLKSDSSSPDGVLLVVSRDMPGSAFTADKAAGEIAVPAENLVPLPSYLKSRYIESCLIEDDRLIPVINLRAIHEDLLSQDWRAAAPSLFLEPVSPGEGKTRLFTLGGYLFAADGIDPGNPLFAPGIISTLPGTPDFVAGIALFQRKVLTVIDTAARIGKKGEGQHKAVVSKIGGDYFGFLIEGDRGEIQVAKDKRRILPAAAKKEWLSEAFLQGEEIVPLLNLGGLLDPEAEGEEETKSAPGYTPDQAFEALFLKNDVCVKEFLLMGNRYAIPSSEARELLASRPFRPLPYLPSIIAGIAEHNGELLPVLDIGLCFGGRVQPGKKRKMVLLENGDFRALVPVEALYEEKMLPIEMHRMIPVIMKHRFLYGCYPENEDKQVRLILNIYKITIYFDETMVKELLHAVMGGGEIIPHAELDETLPEGSDTATAAGMAREETGEFPGKAFFAVTAEAPEIPVPAIEKTTAVTDGAGPVGETAPPEEPHEADTAEAGGEEEGEEPPPPEPFAVETAAMEADAAEKASFVPESGGTEEPAGSADRERDERAASPEGLHKEKPVETGKSEEEETPEKPIAAEATAFREESTGGAEAPLSGISISTAGDDAQLPGAARHAEQIAQRESRNYAWLLIAAGLLLAGGALAYFIFPEGRDSSKMPDSEKSQKNGTGPSSGAPDKPVTTGNMPGGPAGETAGKTSSGKEEPAAAVLEIPSAEKAHAVKESSMGGAPVRKVIPETPAPAKQPKQTAVKEGKEAPQERREDNKNKTYPPLGEFDFYTIVKGDTLWDIAAAYSKDPFDYHLVAEDNKIVNPDLIYPDQKLRLQRKWKEHKE